MPYDSRGAAAEGSSGVVRGAFRRGMGVARMKSTYRLEVRSPDAWQPFADVVGLFVAMRVLEELLPSAPLGVRLVRSADGLPVVTIWWPKPVAALGV
jgi:hypothetical protein